MPAGNWRRSASLQSEGDKVPVLLSFDKRHLNRLEHKKPVGGQVNLLPTTMMYPTGENLCMNLCSLPCNVRSAGRQTAGKRSFVRSVALPSPFRVLAAAQSFRQTNGFVAIAVYLSTPTRHLASPSMLRSVPNGQ